MAVNFIFRQLTGNIATDKFWIGFVARYWHTEDSSSVVSCEAKEISAIGISRAEEKREREGFSFPIDLSNEFRTDPRLVTKLSVGMLDANLVYPHHQLLESVDFVFALKNGGCLSELGGETTLAIYEGGRPTGRVLDIYPGHSSATAVLLPLIRTDGGERKFAVGETFSEIRAFEGDIASYCKQHAAQLSEAHAAKIKAHAHAPLELAPVDQTVRSRYATPSPNAALQPQTAVSNSDGAKASRGEQGGHVAATTTTASRSSEEKSATSAVLVKQTPTEATKPAMADSKKRTASWLPKLAIGCAIIGGFGAIFLVLKKNPETSQAQGAAASLNSQSPSLSQRAPVPSISVPRSSPATRSTTTIPPVPHSGNSISREQLGTLGYGDHLEKVKFALASASANDWNSVDNARDWLKLNKQTSQLPATTEARRRVLTERRYFNEAIEKKIAQAQADKDVNGLQESIVHLNDFLLENFGSASAHLNLAVAYVESGQSKFALAPAFHTIVFNPAGANGWLQMGLALATNGEVANGAAALCITLHIAKHSEKTVNLFSRMDRGQVYDHPQVREALTMSRRLCPGNGWA